MQNSSSEDTKINLRGKLRLRRNVIDSSQSICQTNKKSPNEDLKLEKCDNDKLIPNENLPTSSKIEDSLADFKSPDNKPTYQPILNKYKVNTDKAKKKIFSSKNKTNAKKKKKISDATQPSLESTFFKPQTLNQNNVEIKESFPCPLCLKPFKDDTSQFNHMKICAVKNNISIKQLLDAKELQDRQAEERKAMGLLAAPIIPEKKKVFRSKNYSTGDDQQLQLVMALSESLFEAKQQEELEQAAILSGIPSECIRHLSEEERRATLQNFGFTSSKPIIEEPIINRAKKKKSSCPTVLQTRSKEDKDRVLTERIACILTGDEALTQAKLNTELISVEKIPIVLKSKYLKDILRTTGRIWDQSKLTKKFNKYYVEKLESYLKSSNKTLDLQNSSFILKNSNNEEQNSNLLDESIKYEPMEIDVLIEQSKEEQNLEIVVSSESDNMNSDLDFMKKMISNWGEALNDSRASDIIIFAKDKKYIYAHKLVFSVQCHSILLDVTENDTEIHPYIKEKISWVDKDEVSVLAFLEFIYCGIIYINICVFENDSQMSELKSLAKLYKVNGLFTYLSFKQNEFKRLKIISSTRYSNNSSNYSSNHKNINFDQPVANEIMSECNSNPKARKSLSFDKPFKMVDKEMCSSRSLPVTINTNNNSQKNFKRRTTVSPDLFGSESEVEEESVQKSPEKESSLEKENYVNFKTNLSVISNNNLNIDNDEMSDSQKTIVNLSCDSDQDVKENVYNNEKINQVEELYFKENLKDNNKIFNDSNEKAQTLPPNSPRLKNHEKIVKLENINSGFDDLDNEDYQDDLIYNAVTPPRTELTNDILCQTSVCSTSKENKNKTQKSLDKISFVDDFIKKVRKQNAKGLLETDSENDSPLVQEKRKNPFSIRNKNDSYSYLLKDGTKQKHSKVLSLIEHDVIEDKLKKKLAEKDQNLLENKMDHTFFNKTFHESDSIEDDNYQLIHANTKKLEKISELKLSKHIDPQSSKKISVTEYSFSNSNDETEISIVNDSDLSRYSKYKKYNKHHNSIDKYREELNLGQGQNSTEENINISLTSNKNISGNSMKKPCESNNDITSLQDITLVSDSEEEENEKSFDLPTVKKCLRKKPSIEKNTSDHETSKNSAEVPRLNNSLNKEDNPNLRSTNIEKEERNDVIDISSDTDDECTQKNMMKDSVNLFESNEKNKSVLLEKVEENSDEIEDKINEILEPDLSLKLTEENSKVTVNDFLGEKEKNFENDDSLNLSPLSIISIPDLEVENKEANKSEISNKKNDFKINSQDDDYFKDFEFDNDWVLSPPKNLIVEATTEKRNSPKLDLLCESPIVSSPILSQNRTRFKSSTNKIRKKLITKSASAMNISSKEIKGNILQKSSTFSTPEQKKKKNPDSELSDMDTPKLHQELRKFGLKPQNRKNAKILLRSCYSATSTLHSQKRECETNTSSEDEKEPPLKKRHTDKVLTRKTIESQENFENRDIIAEEMDNDGEADIPINSENTLTINNAFNKLLNSNRELHNKILTYEPIPLKTIHSILKQNGFKCKANDLMDFLDQQGIIFQLPNDNRSRTKKKDK